MRNNNRSPKIRFKGFTGDWEQRKFPEFVQFYNGQTYKPEDVQDDGVLVLRSSNVKNDEIVDADNVYLDKSVANAEQVRKGDIIVVVRNGSRALIGKHAEIKREMPNTVIGAFMTGIRSEHSSFVNALLGTPQFEREIEMNMGATINQITGYMFSKMAFMIPSGDEQDKIGAYFKGLDDLIALHQRKYEKLQSLKKAYLSEMFPLPGERRPRRRFAGFTGDWEQRKLSDETKSIDTGKSKFAAKENGDYEILGSTSVIGYDDDYDYEGDFLLTARVGANAGELYRHSGQVKISDNTVFIQGNHLDFTYYCLMQFDIKKLSFGTGQPLVKASELRNLELLFPCPDERDKIGAYFTEVDNLIALYQRKLAKLQALKKAYLTEMFP